MEAPQPKKSLAEILKAQLWTIAAIVVLSVSFLAVFFILTLVLRGRGKLQINDQGTDDSGLETVSPTPTVQTSFEIKTSEVTSQQLEIIGAAGDKAQCQPESFDPKTAKYSKVEQSGVPSSLYEYVEGQNTYTFNKNGWIQEGTDKPQVNSPYQVDDYYFGCASSFSHVLEITKTNKRSTDRVALFQHVIAYQVLDDKNSIYIVYNEKNESAWVKKAVIFTLSTGKKMNLPVTLPCVGSAVVVGKDQFLVYGTASKEDGMQKTLFCQFSNAGAFQKAIEMPVEWSVVGNGRFATIDATYFTKDRIALTSGIENDKDNLCSVRLVDILSASSISYYKLPKAQKEGPLCPKVEYNFAEVLSGGTKLQYRVTSYDEIEQKLVTTGWNDAAKVE